MPWVRTEVQILFPASSRLEYSNPKKADECVVGCWRVIYGRDSVSLNMGLEHQ